jgi:transcriptional antiterminator RfaH
LASTRAGDLVPWWVAQPQPSRQLVGIGHLRLFGFTVYQPRMLERRTNHGKRITIEQPLFPGYAFVATATQWYRARNAPGVVRIVHTGFVPAEVSDDVVESIRVRERNGLVELPERHLVPGAPVRITSGPFHDHIGIFSDMNGSERVGVLLNLLGAERRVAVLKSHIEVVDG